MTHSGLWLPRHLRPARKPIRVVFYHSKKLDRIEVGFPEQFPVPPVMVAMGFEKVICTTAREVEKWSAKKRAQEKRDAEMTDEEREKFEGPIRDAIRKDLLHRMLTARNEVNREFCRYALAQLDLQEARARRVVRESFMHQEGFEDGR